MSEFRSFSLTKLEGNTKNTQQPAYAAHSPQFTPPPDPPAPTMPNDATLPPDNMEGLVPETVENSLFVPGYLRTQIGKIMRIDFLIGDQLISRTGRLREVGAAYIILQQANIHQMCDLFSIKFAVIFEDLEEYCEDIVQRTP